MRQWLSRLGTTIGMAVALSVCHQNGTVFTVSSSADAVDVAPGDGICAASTGTCTLRAAVMEANALPGVELIDIQRSHVILSIAGSSEDGSATGDLDITEEVVIKGAPSNISGSGSDRLFDLLHPTGLVEMHDLHMNNGNEGVGAGIRHRAAGAWWMSDSSIVGTNADANVIDLAAGSGATRLLETTLAGNTTTGGATILTNRGTTLTTRNLATVGNDLYGINGLAGTTTLDHATIANNLLGLTGTLTVSHAIVADNRGLGDCAPFLGGGLAITSGGDNLESATSCGFTAPGDQQNADARVLPMAGQLPDQLVARIAATSDARDAAGPNSFGSCAGGLDAAGTSRPQHAACDIGAWELVAGPGCAAPTGGGAYFCDLAGIDLSNETLNFDDFSGGDAMIAQFDGVTLTNADLAGSNLNGSFLYAVDTQGASFAGATLRATAWAGADLAGADFTDADLLNAFATATDFAGATWSNTICPSGVNSDANGGNCTGQF
ncbi:MAG: pentapeptide repeat-containing protein [Acidimicrobiales bacterium]|jgi:hypothetical protein|nr:pentapeptide repeat-containing protein [Acidimicrobiales bacterium]